MTSGKKNMHHALENTAIFPTSEVYKWATTLVVATHPDSEVMGCGGAIALLREMGYRVHVLFMCDGSQTYPHGQDSTATYQADLQKYEVEMAMSSLGVSHESITFLDLRDSLVPGRHQEGFEKVVQLCHKKIADFIPDTVLIPWRYNKQQDHQAVWQIMQEALRQEHYRYNVIEYALKPWLEDEQLGLLAYAEHSPWRLDSKPVLEHKIKALSRYHTKEISFFEDETREIILNSELLSHMTHPWEIFLQTHD